MRILVVSDGRRGIENQALGLAEAVCRHAERPTRIATHVLRPSSCFAALPPTFQLALRRDFRLPDADLVIGCGRQAVAPLIALRRSGSAAFTVFVQDPRTDPSRFDLVVAPDHDGLSGAFVETMIGSPNRITRDALIGGTLSEPERLSDLPMPRAMIAIGGPSRTHTLSKAVSATHQAAAKQLADQGYSLMITTSRRTPDEVVQEWQAFAHRQPYVWLHTAEMETSNPYLAFLGGADVILVTEDSTNMLTESCSTGKPTYRLPMEGGPGKFKMLYYRLKTRCGVRRFDGTLDVTDYPPLSETDRLAQRVLDRMTRS